MSTFALSLPLVRFEGSKSYSPLLFFKYVCKYILKATLATRIMTVIINNVTYISLGINSVSIRTKKIITKAIEE